MAPPPLRHSVRIRFLISLAIGVGAGITAGTQLGLVAGLLLGWAFLAIVNVTWILIRREFFERVGLGLGACQ